MNDELRPRLPHNGSRNERRRKTPRRTLRALGGSWRILL